MILNNFALAVIFIAGSVPSIKAASVIVPSLQTGGQPSVSGLEIHSSADHIVDLSNQQGLVAGQNILVTLAAATAPVYMSSFTAGGGPLSYSVTETLSLIIGGQSFSSLVVIAFSTPSVIVTPGTTNIVGFNNGGFFEVIAVTVPWGTDISAVTIRLAQDGIITGGQFIGTNTASVDGLIAGGTRLQNLSLGFASVPEPGTLGLLALGCSGLVRRRNRALRPV
ncbi:MAG: PEP-CTERM sorting domain-containing protein [Verrucomicrobiota bacterium]